MAKKLFYFYLMRKNVYLFLKKVDVFVLHLQY